MAASNKDVTRTDTHREKIVATETEGKSSLPWPLVMMLSIIGIAIIGVILMVIGVF